MIYDVIVVGAGPAGCAAAKRCTEYGMSTLILEKKRLPRNKVCSGMVLDPVARILIKEVFGGLPQEILCKPQFLSGTIFHIPGIGNQEVNHHMLLTWRKDLDWWMAKRAKAKGAEMWEGARVSGLSQKRDRFLVTVRKDGEKTEELEAQFVVGADGAVSTVRRFLFPYLKVGYVQAYQEYYQGELDLDKGFFHSFRTTGSTSLRFGVIHKDNLLGLSFGAQIGQLRNLVWGAKEFLANSYGFSIGQKPVRKEGCLEPVLHNELISGVFSPAKGNALLVGDAGGFITPVILEGIGIGIKSGLFAADSIQKSMESGEKAGVIFLKQIKDIVSMLKGMQPLVKRIAEETEWSKDALLESQCRAYEEILSWYESRC